MNTNLYHCTVTLTDRVQVQLGIFNLKKFSTLSLSLSLSLSLFLSVCLVKWIMKDNKTIEFKHQFTSLIFVNQKDRLHSITVDEIYIGLR